jgi:5'-nucleotidase
MHRRTACAVVALLVSALALTAAPASAGSKQKPFRILVTNDDGVTAPGISELVEGLRELPGVKVMVVAPAENKTGAGNTTTPGALTTTKTKTAGGYPAIAVSGFPADTIIYAVDQDGVKQRPDLVISGINQGQNLGFIADETSGTVGAARAAAARGIPALAISQGLRESEEPDYPASVKETLKWLKQHRKALTPRKGKDVEVVFDSINVPTCASGLKTRGLVEVPQAPQETPGVVAIQDCASTLEDPTNDIEAFNNGFVTLSELPVPTT